MSEHTKGPYGYGEDNDGWYLESLSVKEKLGHGDQIAYCLKEEDARRISAVLNACIYLSDDALAGGWTAKGIIDYSKALERKNEELLEVLKDLLEQTGIDGWWAEKARDAIAKATGGAA